MLVSRSGWNYGIADDNDVLDIKLLINWQFNSSFIFGRVETGIDIFVNG